MTFHTTITFHTECFTLFYNHVLEVTDKQENAYGHWVKRLLVIASMTSYFAWWLAENVMIH